MTAQTTAGSGLPERRVLIAFLSFILVGGGASIAIRVTYGELPPFWSAAARFALAALVFWIMVLIKRLSVAFCHDSARLTMPKR